MAVRPPAESNEYTFSKILAVPEKVEKASLRQEHVDMRPAVMHRIFGIGWTGVF
jgi:hypothetical protein